MTILITDRSSQINERFESLVLEADSALSKLRSRSVEESQTLFEEFPKIVLLDMDMRVNESFDLLKYIKDLYFKTIVLALSTHTTRGIREESEKLEADYFLDKYQEFDRIPKIIEKICEKRN